jgi:virulence-associated protein VagC
MIFPEDEVCILFEEGEISLIIESLTYNINSCEKLDFSKLEATFVNEIHEKVKKMKNMRYHLDERIHPYQQ